MCCFHRQVHVHSVDKRLANENLNLKDKNHFCSAPRFHNENSGTLTKTDVLLSSLIAKASVRQQSGRRSVRFDGQEPDHSRPKVSNSTFRYLDSSRCAAFIVNCMFAHYQLIILVKVTEIC